MKCSIISRRPFGVFSWSFFVFKFIVHVLPTLYTYYPSLNKLQKTFIKVVKMSRFAIVRKSILISKRCTQKIRIREPITLTYMRSIRSSGVGNKPPRKKKNWQIPGGMSGREHGITRVKLNYALRAGRWQHTSTRLQYRWLTEPKANAAEMFSLLICWCNHIHRVMDALGRFHSRPQGAFPWGQGCGGLLSNREGRVARNA